MFEDLKPAPADKILALIGAYRADERPNKVDLGVGVYKDSAGKTPVTIALAQHLRALGLHPGVISRGYGRSTHDCRAVLPGSTPAQVGDEPLLIARAAQVPVYVARRRADAGRALLAEHPQTDVIVCDDGLQHLALARDVEVCVFNDQGVGNGWLLPAGPLREPWPRPVDWVLYAGAPPPEGAAPQFALARTLADEAVDASGRRVPLAALRGQRLHALAAIARPEDFFAMLRQQGLAPEHEEALPDHSDFNSWQRNEDNRYTVICTEKDAVKLWPRHPGALAVPLRVQLAPAFVHALNLRLAPLLPPKEEHHGSETA